MGEVSTVHKEINGRLFDKAYSDDPQIACQAIGKLVATLKSATNLAGITEYDEKLNKAFLGANRAWAELTRDKEPGKAMQTVRAVLTFELADVAFDTRITKIDTNSFVARK